VNIEELKQKRFVFHRSCARSFQRTMCFNNDMKGPTFILVEPVVSLTYIKDM